MKALIRRDAQAVRSPNLAEDAPPAGGGLRLPCLDAHSTRELAVKGHGEGFESGNRCHFAAAQPASWKSCSDVELARSAGPGLTVAARSAHKVLAARRRHTGAGSRSSGVQPNRKLRAELVPLLVKARGPALPRGHAGDDRGLPSRRCRGAQERAKICGTPKLVLDPC